MLSGRDTLGHLDTTLQTLRRQLDTLNRTLQELSSRSARAQLRQGNIIRQLAAIRLDALESAAIERDLSNAERQVLELLERRERRMAEAGNAVEQAETELVRLETERVDAHAEVDRAARDLAEAEARAQALLEKDEAFLAQLERCREADAIAVGAAEKAAVAAGDREDKRGPYDEDPLFSYLWARGYGTPAYEANLLARALDGWVARISRFEKARRDYWMLLEIPKRLEQHAAQVRARADDEVAALEDIERRVADANGVGTARSALDAAERQQDETDTRITTQESALLELRAEIDRYAAGDDEQMQRCLQLLADAMRHHGIDHLASMALATMTLEDDQLVAELRDAREEEQDIQQELQDQRAIHRETVARVRELSDVRSRFKRQRFDDLRSGFDHGDLLLTLLQGFLSGTARGGTLWDALKRYQRYNDVSGAWPDFGSGGISRRGGPRSRRSGQWHWPGRSRGKGGFRLPKAPKLPKLPRGGRGGSRGRGGRGGFRTGGGF